MGLREHSIETLEETQIGRKQSFEETDAMGAAGDRTLGKGNQDDGQGTDKTGKTSWVAQPSPGSQTAPGSQRLSGSGYQLS